MKKRGLYVTNNPSRLRMIASIDIPPGSEKELQITSKEFLRPITSEDDVFAKKIINEYNIRYDELCWLIRDIRDQIEDDKSIYKKPNTYLRDSLEDFKKLSDNQIKELVITTTETTLKIKSIDPYFKLSISGIIKDIEKAVEEEKVALKYLSDFPFNKIVYYFFNFSPLGPFQKNVVIGMFFVHFGLYKNKPIMTEEEFKANQKYGGKPIEAQDYKHYLNDRVKILTKSFSPRKKIFHLIYR